MPFAAQPLWPALILAPSDLKSETWAKLVSHMERRLQTLREQNDGQLDGDKTARLRGQIAEVKGLLALGHPPAAPMSDEA